MKDPKTLYRLVVRRRVQIAGFFALAVAVSVVHWVWVRPVIEERRQFQVQVQQEQVLASKYRERLAQAKGLKARLLEEQKQFEAIEKRLVQERDPYQLAASLGELVGSGKSGELVVKSYQVLNTVEYGLYREVQLRYNLMATVTGLYLFLDSLRNAEEAIVIREINVQASRQRRGPDLIVNVVLAALMGKPPGESEG